MHRVQELGRRQHRRAPESHAGAPPQIRGEPQIGVGHPRGRLGPRPRRRRPDAGRGARVYGHVAGISGDPGAGDGGLPQHAKNGRAGDPGVMVEMSDQPAKSSEAIGAKQNARSNAERSPQHAAGVPGEPVVGSLGSNNRRAGVPAADVFPFSVSVGNVYDGPLDLLLDLIRKQDIDIYDIPIAQITAQYLAYVEHIRNFDIDLAAEFIYMASLLIHIKSKMLLPKDPSAAADEQDPRTVLVQKQQLEDAVLSNPALREFRNDEGAEPELAADVVDLVRTFQQVLERAKDRPSLQVDDESVSVAQMIEYVRRRLMLEDRPIRLKQLLRHLRSRSALVCAFLAILEMVRLQAVVCRQDDLFGEVVLKKSFGFDRLSDEGGVRVRDDWR